MGLRIFLQFFLFKKIQYRRYATAVSDSALVSAMRREESAPSASASGEEASAAAVVEVGGAAAPVTAATAAASVAAHVAPLGCHSSTVPVVDYIGYGIFSLKC